MSAQKPNLWGLLSDAARVIKSHSLHFLALSALFLLPVFIFEIIYPFLMHQPSIPPSLHRSLILVSPPQPKNGILQSGNPQFLITIIYIILLLLFSLSATSSITYTALRGFSGKPVNFISSLKSIPVSFFPLLGTTLVLELIYLLIGLGVGIITFLAYNALMSLGFTIMDYEGGYFRASVIVMVAVLFLALVYLQVEWILAMVVVVGESKWGVQSLKRSSYLVKGMRGIAVSLILLFVIPGGLLGWWYYNVMKSMDAADGISWSSVVLLIVYAVVLTLLSLYSMVAQTILFAYCKESHGETVLEIDEELGMGYGKLAGDE